MASKKKSSRKKSAGSAASPASTRSGGVDAVKLLKADHAKVKELFETFENARTDKQKIKLATTICQELTIHTTVEEEIFYPAAREALEDDDLLDEANVEHQSAKELISQIEAGKPGEDMWEAKVKVLGEYINHHVKEEETEMFPALRKTDVDLKALGAAIEARKLELTP
jgi:hemerythrin superfamily protein